MKQDKRAVHENTGRQALDRLCSMSGLLLSIACCIALVHVELRVQEQQQLTSHIRTVCDQMETEILRKLQENYKHWGDMTGESWEGRTGEMCVLSTVAAASGSG